ncbi:hypothetical protein BaRGS_00029535 [Batillaria attramentaria]|uniref:Uncharacterized protein n=1 Tax=Batillaria attramentaria TaxID=370345 RepID=A0ABD0JWW2_9CAEN
MSNERSRFDTSAHRRGNCPKKMYIKFNENIKKPETSHQSLEVVQFFDDDLLNAIVSRQHVATTTQADDSIRRIVAATGVKGIH